MTSDVPAHGALGVPSSSVAGTFSEQAWRREGRGWAGGMGSAEAFSTGSSAEAQEASGDVGGRMENEEF